VRSAVLACPRDSVIAAAASATQRAALEAIRRMAQPRRPSPRNRPLKELAIDIIASEIRSAQREVWLEASRLVLAPDELTEIARRMRERAERAIKPE
jgi:hypothetical protein